MLKLDYVDKSDLCWQLAFVKKEIFALEKVTSSEMALGSILISLLLACCCRLP